MTPLYNIHNIPNNNKQYPKSEFILNPIVFLFRSKFSAKMEPLVMRMTGSSTNVTALEQVIMDQNASCQAWFSQWLVPNVLYFGPEKCLKEFRITCWTCFEKASLVHFISLRNLWSCVKRQVWSTLKLFERASLVQIRRKIWTKLAISKQDQHVILNSFKHVLDQNIRR